MQQSIIQVDAFTDQPFQGNPAAVCVLPAPREVEWMQKVAQEMNLSETAFLVQQGEDFHLRWFTPTTEVPLCGHATLASAHVLWTEGHLALQQEARFQTRSGLLTATYQGGWIELNFPAIPSEDTLPCAELETALNIPIRHLCCNAHDYLVETESDLTVRHMQPNIQLLKTLPINGVIVTSRSSDSAFDFVSRYFAPGVGIDEDPVTGYAHCCLAPFWRDRLGKDHFLAYQASRRGGVVKVRYDGGDRVFLAGRAVTVLRGVLVDGAA